MKVHEIEIKYNMIRNDGRAQRLDAPEKVADYMRGAFDERPEQESFWVILLNQKNYAKGRHMISLGTLTLSLVHPREVFRLAVQECAAAIIVVHNHPSGDPSPSSADIRVTRQLMEASAVLDIKLLDHVIIGNGDTPPGEDKFYSFNDNGML